MNQSMGAAATGTLEIEARPKRGLTAGRKLSLAIGDYGLNLYWQSVTYFLMFFYTDIVGLSVATAGVIYMAATIFDGCIDPVMGMVIDRTRSRWGRYRPWICIGAVPLALSFMLLYWSPSLQGSALVIAITVVHLLFRTCYTCVAVPIASLSARVTQDSRERSSLTGYRMLFAAAGSMTVAMLTQPFGASLGVSQAMGFFWFATLSGAVATAIFLFVAYRTKEMIDAADEQAAPALTVKAAGRAVMVNRAFLTLVTGLLGATLAMTLISKSLVYYFKYVVHNEAAGRTALTIATTSAILMVPCWAWIARRIGKRNVWLSGVTIALSVLTVFAIFRPANPIGATLFYVSLQASVTAFVVSYWAMLPDTVEFGEWRSGLRLESTLVGIFMFFQKLGLGLAAGLFGWALSFAGVVNATADAQIMESVLPVVMIVLTGAGALLSGAAMLLSPLKLGVHEQICAELKTRRQMQR